MELLSHILLIFSASVLIVLLCSKARIPSIIGFLLAGIALGPKSLGLIQKIHEVELLAEIGAILLLFTIGIEFSFKHLLRIRRAVLLGGSVQVVLTVTLGAGLSLLVGRGWREALFLGCLLAMSSTAIVLKLLQERAEIESPQGLTSLGILIFQDLMIIPMMLLIPLLATTPATEQTSTWLVLGKIVLLFGGSVLAAKWIVPFLLYQIARTRIRELFLLAILTLCLGVAWVSSLAGLSLALGAFLAGLILSESEYSHDALASMLPFRDVFLSFFFISIGMLLDIRFLWMHLPQVMGLVVFVVLLKLFAASAAALALGYRLRTILLVGLTLCQVGEFSFLLSSAGMTHQLLNAETYQLFLSVSLLTMVLTPLLIALAPSLSSFLADRLSSYPQETTSSSEATSPEQVTDHLVIVGYGLNGQNLTQAATQSGIPHIIMELNPETVRRESQRGRPIFFGDASQEAVLLYAGADVARVAVVAIQDLLATRLIIERLRALNPALWIIARTRFVADMELLFQLGANEVIPEEFETSIEIFSRVLRSYLVPHSDIEETIAQIRSEGYAMFRSLSPQTPQHNGWSPLLGELDFITYRVEEEAPAASQSLLSLKLRQRHKVTVVAIKKEREVQTNPHGEATLDAGDIVVLLGSPERLSQVAHLFRVSPPEEPASSVARSCR